ncbi:prion-like-(Q/N-rich) domain-bearing protein 25 [Microplitis demolitor]|uniref:prion-like-(Q/N-rich) domain-bearing protein 25 n=1 Tax=Microplitis demolitor TaxID=69319 RepID=UPI00235B5F6D|nr:prion-like-(Q/N-rich) domain-bearing protein 25 [Microplitis demolitor]
MDKTVLGMSCTNDKDCSAVLDSICSNNKKCICKPNHVQLNPTTCAPMLGEFCDNNRICGVNHSICIDNLCKCKIDFLPRSQVQCLPRILKSQCENDAMCDAIKFAKCSRNKICTCSSNTLLTRENRCAPILDGSCWNDSDCMTNNSVCIHNKCQCKTGFVRRNENTCNKGHLGMFCRSDKECNDIIEHSICLINNKCFCDFDYIPINGTICAPIINKNCFYDDLCATKNSDCIENKCQCKPEYTFSIDKCIPKYLNESCDDDQECEKIDNSKCSVNKKCVCKHNYSRLNETTCWPKLTGVCLSDEQCTVTNSVCVNKRCQCKSHYLAVLNEECLAVNLGQKCLINSDCRKISHAICSDDYYCVCRLNYTQFNDTTCAVKMKGYCENDKQCVFDHSFCNNTKCQCKSGFILRNDNECISHYIGKSCATNEDCNEIQHAKCLDKKKCVCRENNVQLDIITCAPLLGKFCWKNETCATDNSICVDSECQCKVNYLERSNQCLPIFSESYCANDQNCIKIKKNSFCGKNRECICKQNYFSLNETVCAPLLNQSCQNNEICATDNAECVKNKCACKANVTSQSNNQCLPSQYMLNRIHLDLSCKEDIDCRKIKNARCSINKKCVCKSNHVKLNKKVCAPLLEEFCSTSRQCAIGNSECIDNICKCKIHFVPVDNSLCILVIPSFATVRIRRIAL